MASKDLESLGAPYELLLERLEETIKLRNLILELVFIILYFVFFMSFVATQAQTESAFEVNAALKQRFALAPFPNEAGEATTFDQISAPFAWKAWFENVALETITSTHFITSPTASPNQTQVFFGLLWKKKVDPVSGKACPQAPEFLWHTSALARGLSTSDRTCLPPWTPSTDSSKPPSIGPFTYYSSSPVHVPGAIGTLEVFYPSSGYYSPPIDPTWRNWWPTYGPSFLNNQTRMIGVIAVGFEPTYKIWSMANMYAEVMGDMSIFTFADFTSGPLMYCPKAAGGACQDDNTELILASLLGAFIILHFIFLVVARRLYAIYIIIFKSGRKSLLQVLGAFLMDLLDIRVALDLAQAALGLITLTYISEVYWQRSRYNSLSSIEVAPLNQQGAAKVVSSLSEYGYMQQIFGAQIILFNIQAFKYFPALPCCAMVRLGWVRVYMDVIKVFLMYWVFIFAYALVGLVVFGSTFDMFASYASSLSGTVKMILGESSFELLRGISPDFAWAFMLVFILFFVYILQALLISVVIEGFRLAFNATHESSSQGASPPSWKESITKLITRGGEARSSSEYATRLRAWKAMRVNKDVEYLTRAQLKSALRGQTYNRIDISDETVDEVFLLVRAHEMKRLDTLDETPKVTYDLLNSQYANENSALMPQLMKTMFEIKLNEVSLMRDLGLTMRSLRKSKRETEEVIRRADRANAEFVKEE